MNHTERVLHDFGQRAQDYPWHAIYDIACLPHPKEDIRDALFAAILAQEMNRREDTAIKNALGTLLTSCLPRYQKGVGKEPLYSVGYDLESTILKPEFARALLQEVSAEAKEKRRINSERFEQMETLVELESAAYFELLAKLPSNSSKKADYEDMVKLLRTHDHSIDKYSKLLPPERRVMVDKAFNKSSFDIDDESESDENEVAL